ncbi:hypothetical protein G9A89_014040 [Geosiphon pyriformis]|nr:hypothetical protein G9A89_014040 [Geosiphon pyriformis]
MYLGIGGGGGGGGGGGILGLIMKAIVPFLLGVGVSDGSNGGGGACMDMEESLIIFAVFEENA